MPRGYPLKSLFLVLALAAAARPAGAQVCDPFPQVGWWKDLSHESVTRYVERRHNGDWKPYIQKWQKQGERLKRVLGKGGKVVIKSMNVTLKGQSLSAYIKKMEKRITVTECLAREAAS